jgi:IMP dehydrogenase/GMP reductase
MSRYHISGVPITDGEGKLVGILTNRDTRFVEPGPQPVSEFMTSDGLVTAQVGTTLEEAKEILHQHRIEKLPLVDEDGYLKGLITVKDIQKKLNFPMQAADENGRLLCAGAIGVGDAGLERLDLLVKAGVDVAVIDTAHGHTALVLQTVREAKNRYPNLPIVAGNAATADGVRDLVQAGADAVKIGIGAGSICTTRVVSGAGMPQLTAVLESAAECHKHDVPCIADGGIKYSGDIVKAMAAGADAVMLGSMLAHRDLKPGNVLMRGQRIALSDFGLAKHALVDLEITDPGIIFGTPHYMSPEQGHGEQVDERSDLYSLGVILHEMLCGERPFTDPNPMAIIYKHRNQPVPRLPAANAAWQQVVDALLAKLPADRFRSARLAEEALRTAAGQARTAAA